MNNDIITDDDVSKGASSTLGAHYFSSRRIVRDAMSALEDKSFDDAVSEITKKLYEKLYDAVECSMWGDVECNLQSKMWTMVDEIVRGILSGDRWVLDRYVLGSRYDCEKIRAAVSQHLGDELRDHYVTDLEKKIETLESDVKWFRER